VSYSSPRVNNDDFSNLSGVKSISEFKDFDKVSFIYLKICILLHVSLTIYLFLLVFLIYVRIPFVLLLQRRSSSIPIDTDGIMKPVLSVLKLQGQVVRVTNAHVGRKLRFR